MQIDVSYLTHLSNNALISSRAFFNCSGSLSFGARSSMQCPQLAQSINIAFMSLSFSFTLRFTRALPSYSSPLPRIFTTISKDNSASVINNINITIQRISMESIWIYWCAKRFLAISSPIR